MRRRRWLGLIVTVMVLSIIGARAVGASDVLQGDQCQVSQSETITGSVFVLCRSLVVDGVIDGNLIGVATTIELNGSVYGDIYLLGGQLDVAGIVAEDLHFAGAVLRVLPTAEFTDPRGDVIALASSTALQRGADLPGSFTGLGYQLLLNRNVSGDVSFAGSALRLNSEIGGDVAAQVTGEEAAPAGWQLLFAVFPLNAELIPPGLMVGSAGVVGGDLRYTSSEAGRIEGRVIGATEFNQVNTQIDFSQIDIGQDEQDRRAFSDYVNAVLREFLTLALTGVLVLWVAPRALQTPIRNLHRYTLTDFGIGALTLLASVPVLLLLALFSVLLVLLLAALRLNELAAGSALVLGVANVGSTGLFVFVCLFLTRVLVCAWIGRLLVRAFIGDDNSQRIAYIGLFVGVLLLSLLAALPTAGPVINFLVIVLGLGGLAHTVYRLVIEARGPAPTVAGHSVLVVPALPARSEEAIAVPPPIIDETPRQPGSDNLPDGFQWWE